MTRQQRKMRLGAFLINTGHHVTSWRHPEAQADAGVNIAHFAEIARTAERGRFDLIFFADCLAVREAHIDALSRSAQYVSWFEPLTLLSALAMVTEHIGLVATATTSYNDPYHIARKFASIDHISGGRAGWNIVTSALPYEAYNFGRDSHYEKEERYLRAREFTEIVKGLWDSWDDDAFCYDKQSGLFFHPEKMHTLGHRGQHFAVKGPLNIARPPQGYPVMVQAGASPTGIAFAAEYGEAIFTAHLTYQEAKTYYDELKGQASNLGRNPEHVVVLPGLSVLVAPSESEANEKFEYLQSLIHPMVAREILSFTLGGVDLSPYPMDAPMPELAPPPGATSSFTTTMRLAREERLTVRQLAMRIAGARQRVFIKGTPAQVVDHMEDWFRKGALDGYNLLPPYLPGSLNDFVDLVVPELQRRGLFRTQYEGRTLRENLGLPRPPSRYARRT